MTVFILISILIFLVLAITKRVLIFPTVIVNLLISPFIQLLLYAFWNSVTDAYIIRFLCLDELAHSLVQNVLLNSGNTFYLEDYFAWHQYSRSFNNVFCSMTFCYKFDEEKKEKQTKKKLIPRRGHCQCGVCTFSPYLHGFSPTFQRCVHEVNWCV